MADAQVATRELEAVGSLSTLEAIFPETSPDGLRLVLDSHGGHLERTIDYLLAQPMPLTGTDRGPHAEPRPANSLLEIPNVMELEPAQQQLVISNIKDMVLPSLTDKIAAVQFPPVDQTVDKLHFTLRDMRVTSLDLRPDQVLVSFADDQLHIHVQNLDVEMLIGDWSFERTVIPRVRDTGTARVVLRGVDAAVKLAVGPDGDTEILDPQVVISQVRLRFSESRISWLYNTFAVILRPLLKSLTEKVLLEAIVSSINEQVDDWSDWAAGG